jgi:hypothetical protein
MRGPSPVTTPAASEPGNVIAAGSLFGPMRKRQRLAARITRLLLSSNGDAGRALALVDDLDLPAPFGTYYRAAAAVHEDGSPITFDAVSERLRLSAMLDAVGGYRGIEALKRGDDEAPGPDTLAECVEAFRPLVREIQELDADVERLTRAGFRIESPDVDGPPLSRPALATDMPQNEEADPPVECWPAPVKGDAYHGVLGDLVLAVEGYTEADPVGILAQLLVGFGNLLNGGPYFSVEATRHHGNEFLALVGRTAAGRKGTAWDQARRPLAAVDEGWARDRIQGGLASGEALIHAVRDRREEKQAIRERGRVTDYQTVETDAGVSDKRLLIIETELSRVLKVMSREGATLSTILRQAWDGPNLRVMAKQSPATATGAHVSLIAHITAEELIRELQQTEAASGFGNRFLWCCVKRARFLPDGADLSAVDFAPLERALSNAVNAARRVGEMTRDPEARDLWRAEYERLSAGRPGLLGAMLSRAEAHVLRLSMLYALADSSAIIKRVHLQAALAMWDYMARSAAFVFGERLGDPTADELLRALRAAPDGMTRNDMTTHFGRNKSAAEIARALSVLARQNLARPTPVDRTGQRGRPVERWQAVTQGA